MIGKDASCPNGKLSTWALIQSIAKSMWPKDDYSVRKRVAASFILTSASKVLSTAFPLMLKKTVDTIHSNPSHPSTPLLLAACGFSHASGALVKELRGALFARVTQKSVRDLSCRVFAHLQTLDENFFWHPKHETGAISRILDRGSRGLSFIFGGVLFHGIPGFLEVGLVTALVGRKLGWKFAVGAVGMSAAYSEFTRNIMDWRLRIRKEMNERENRASSRLIDSLVRHETVKYLRAEDYEVNRYDEALSEVESSAVGTQTSLSALHMGQSGILSSAMAAMMVMAAGGVRNGSMTAGDIVLIHGLLNQLSKPLTFLSTVYRELKHASVDIEQMLSLLDISPSVKECRRCSPLFLDEGPEIKFSNVTFGYDSSSPILRNFSLRIPPGRVTAIVGGNGVGKTTLIRLLYRIVDPQSGLITLNHQPIRNVSLNGLRSSMTVVPQDTSMALLNKNVSDNLLYGYGENADPAQMDRVLQRVIGGDLRKKVTAIGERGILLSGGERQRVTLGRALLSQPHILLCDEAFSALEPSAEQQMMMELKKFAKGRRKTTVVVVSHRMSAAQHADHIAVINDGQVVEEGNHRDLIQANSMYSEFIRQQPPV